MKVRFVVRASIKSNGLHNQAMGFEVDTCMCWVSNNRNINHKSCSMVIMFSQFQSQKHISSFSANTNLSSQDSSGSNHLLDRTRQHGCSHSAPDTPAHRCRPDNSKSLNYPVHFPPKKTSTFTVETKTHRAGFITVLSPPPWRTCADSIYRVTCSSIRT